MTKRLICSNCNRQERRPGDPQEPANNYVGRVIDYPLIDKDKEPLCQDCFCLGCCPVLAKHGLTELSCTTKLSLDLKLTLASFIKDKIRDTRPPIFPEEDTLMPTYQAPREMQTKLSIN